MCVVVVVVVKLAAVKVKSLDQIKVEKEKPSAAAAAADQQKDDNKVNTVTYVTRHEITGLMYTKYTYSCYSMYLLYCIRFTKSVNCIRFPTKRSMDGENCAELPRLYKKLFNFVVQNLIYVSG